MVELTSEFEICKLRENLTVWESAALVLGVPPSQVCYGSHQEDDYTNIYGEYSNANGAFQSLKKLMIEQMASGSIKGDFVELKKVGSYLGKGEYEELVISVNNLKTWIESNKVKCDFFKGSVNNEVAPYLDKNHPHYSPRLNAAVTVWIEFKDAEIQGNSPKQTMENWLSGKARELDLTHKGKVSKSAIEEVAKIANWSGGGSPTTPKKKEIEQKDTNDFDNDFSEIPF